MSSFTGIGSGIREGLALRSFIEDLHYKRQLRQMQREQWLQEMEDRRRKGAYEDLNLRLSLESMGAVPEGEHQQARSAVEKAFGGWQTALGAQSKAPVPITDTRRTIPTPVGSYSVPTERERIQRERQAGERKAGIEGEQEYAKEAGRERAKREADPLIDIKDEEGNIVGQAPKSRSAEVMERVYQARHPNLHITSATSDAGDVTFTGLNPRTGETKDLGTRKGIGKTKTAGQGGTGLSSKAFEAMKNAQNRIDIARQGPKRDPLAEMGAGAAEAERRAGVSKSQLEAAKAAAAEAAAAYPDELEVRFDKIKLNPKDKDTVDWPRIYPKKNRPTRGGRSASPQASADTGWDKSQPIPASGLNKLLSRPEVKAHGIKDIHGLRKYLSDNGYNVDEGN